MTSQSSSPRFSFLFWIDIESTLHCSVHGYVHTHQFVIRGYPHMDVMFNVDQWQTQGILHCNKQGFSPFRKLLLQQDRDYLQKWYSYVSLFKSFRVSQLPLPLHLFEVGYSKDALHRGQGDTKCPFTLRQLQESGVDVLLNTSEWVSIS